MELGAPVQHGARCSGTKKRNDGHGAGVNRPTRKEGNAASRQLVSSIRGRGGVSA
jgi:hypothetical protein